MYSVETKISDGYPAELVVSIKDKKLSKNIPGEVKLYPLSMFGDDVKEQIGKNISHFIVIDDTKEATVTSFEQSGGLMFFAKDGFLVKEENKTSINSYEDIGEISKDATFSKEILTKFIAIANEYIPSIPKVATITIIVVYTLFAPLGNALYLLFVGLLISLLSMYILKRKVDFVEAYILSMYALPSLIILEAVLSYVPYIKTVVSYIPFFTTIGIGVFLFFMYKETSGVKKQEVVVSA